MKVYLNGKDQPLTFDVDVTNQQPQTAPSPIEKPAPTPAGAKTDEGGEESGKKGGEAQ